MPFIGRDWRSPGEAWVKTESLGWQRMKIIESQLHLSCHQNHFNACSWPPRSQFGQHMEQNCGNREQDSNSQESPEASETSGCEICAHGASQTDSAATSPTGTPERNNARHIHSITISSPYGRFSAPCCAHNAHDNNGAPSSPCRSPVNNRCSSCSNFVDCQHNQLCHNHHQHHHHHHHHHLNHDQQQQQQHHQGSDCARDERENKTKTQAISRSLSRDAPTCSSTTDYKARSAAASSLRYNLSASDLINPQHIHERPSTSNDNQRTRSDKNSSNYKGRSESSRPNMVVSSQQATQNSSTSIRNDELRSRADEPNKGQEPSSRSEPISATLPTTESVAQSTRLLVSASRSPSPSPSLSSPSSPNSPKPPESDRESGNKSYACCCCGSAAPNGALSQHHLMMEMQPPKTAPHCRISVRTREVAMHNTISEAFYRLDFYNAIHDIRRFNYICKLLHLLITQNLTSLSGCATRVLFTMLEQVAWEVSSNKRNVHVIRNLLNELKQTIQKYYCWGRPIGSSQLWQQHFETIERISQIVNGIELSPPKSDTYNVTFDQLPVEMVREILLRLEDYRDLVNSAQASPVMRTMIDGQSIWKKLCRYHFTEQQLKMTLNSGNNSILMKKNSLRGVKYARTTSADGRSSYRNPVAHKQTSSSSSSSSSSRVAATRRQLEQASSGRRGSHADKRANSESGSSSASSSGSSSPSSSKTASYVTNAVKIFDNKQKVVVASSCDRKSADFTSSGPRNGSGGGGNLANGRRGSSKSENHQQQQQRSSAANTCGHSIELDSSNLGIDWERVFHQLRKRFDLKEEYADCLLLCRHCRCLFWKSIGHPCIKSEDMRQQPYPQHHQPVGRQVNKPAGGAHNNNGPDSSAGLAPRRSDQSSSRAPTEGAAGSSSAPSSCRPSVASLRGNFDRATRGSNAGATGDENAQPRGRPSAYADLRHRAGPSARARQPLNNLGAQLREHNASRQQRQQFLPPTGRENGVASRREELVPKHVTITPQAFLKFFSL